MQQQWWPPKACGLAGWGLADAKAGPQAPSVSVQFGQQMDLGFLSPDLMVMVPAAEAEVPAQD